MKPEDWIIVFELPCQNCGSPAVTIEIIEQYALGGVPYDCYKIECADCDHENYIHDYPVEEDIRHTIGRK